MKGLLFCLLGISIVYVQADCTRADRTHTDTNVVRCSYTQEDIYSCYSKKTQCYECQERRKECFYCKCPIAEHTKCETPEKCGAPKCPRKGPFDDEVIESRRQKNKRAH